ncbi:unnamed protein product [Effrenium voratum]|nr:unnamed protein product [Effrenium voratum]
MSFGACLRKSLTRYRDRRPTDPFFYPTTVNPLTGLGLNLIEETTPKKIQADLAKNEERSLLVAPMNLEFEDSSVLQRQNDELARHMQDLERAKSLAAMTSAQALQKIRQRQAGWMLHARGVRGLRAACYAMAI